MSSEDEEYEDEIEEYKPEDNHREETEGQGCIQLMKTFVVCRGKVYVFTVGRKTVILGFILLDFILILIFLRLHSIVTLYALSWLG